jgi:hypothetical protein
MVNRKQEVKEKASLPNTRDASAVCSGNSTYLTGSNMYFSEIIF